jgi:hypothetical protein
VVLSHDDFGFASLSYGFDIPNLAVETYNQLSIVEYLKWHYLNWGGRVLSFFALWSFLQLDLWVWRIAQALLIVFFLVFLANGSKRNNDELFNPWILTLLAACYGLLSLEMMRESVLWITAALVYLWTSILVVVLAKVYRETLIKPPLSSYRHWLLAVLCFMGGWTQEQTGLMLIVFMLVVLADARLRRLPVKPLNVWLWFSAVAGYALVVLAPGNAVRMAHPSSGDFYSLSLIDKFAIRFPNLLYALFGMEHSHVFILLLLASGIGIAYRNRNAKAFSVALNQKLPVILTGISGFYLLVFFGPLNDLALSSSGIPTEPLTLEALLQLLSGYGLGSAVLLLLLYGFLVHRQESGDVRLLGLYLAALAGHFSLIMAPVTPFRTLLPFYLFTMALFAYALGDMRRLASRTVNYVAKFGIGVIAVLALANTAKIVAGYAENAPIHRHNDIVLRDVARRSHAGEEINRVTLTKFDPAYIDCSPWKCDYQVWWIKTYYDLPLDMTVVWK